MNSSQALFLTLIFVVMSAALLSHGVQAQRARRFAPTVHHHHEHHRDHVLDELPDINDPGIMRVLRCNSCKELSKELFQGIHNLYQQKNPSHSELIQLIDGMCEHHTNKYGLVVDPNNSSATTAFSSDPSVDRVQGMWINNFMKERCAQLMFHHEDAIIEKHPEADSLAHFQSMMCSEWDKHCDSQVEATLERRSGGGGRKVVKPLTKNTFSRSMPAADM